jgi:hypothetical protein
VWGLLAVVAVLVAPAAIILIRSHNASLTPTPAVAAPADSASPSAAVPVYANEAARVQACEAQPSANQTTLTQPTQADIDKYGLNPNWARYVDPSRFVIFMPSSWGVSRIGKLVCFRDPTSVKAAAVYSHGNVAGNPVGLIANTRAWEAAANMPDFHKFNIINVDYPEGAADLEYTYMQGNVKMHGVNRMFRLRGEVYTIYYLATDVDWPSDRDLKNIIQPSFTLAR